MAFLELSGVHKSFGRVHVLRGLNLNVDQHAVVCLIGPSGCGKSTLLRCVNRLERIEAGSISLEGEEISGPGVDLNAIRERIGIVFQSYNLFPHMTALANITLAPKRVLHMSHAAATERARELLVRFGLWDKAMEYPDSLSGGQQQRVAIIRALAMEPRVLLLDEVTSALDPELVSEVLHLIRQLATEGMTLVLATHELDFARLVASKVSFLVDGVVHEEGRPEQVIDSPVSPRTRTFVSRLARRGTV